MRIQQNPNLPQQHNDSQQNIIQSSFSVFTPDNIIRHFTCKILNNFRPDCIQGPRGGSREGAASLSHPRMPESTLCIILLAEYQTFSWGYIPGPSWWEAAILSLYPIPPSSSTTPGPAVSNEVS